MTSCTIIVSHYESLPFLRACVRQILKYAHPEIKQQIIICDQSRNGDIDNQLIEFLDYENVRIVHTQPYYSGYGIDVLMRTANIITEYIAQIHCDALPIHHNWLYLPIKLIEENDFSFVGQLQFISKETDTIYPPEPFFAMAQCFNVAKTDTYREMSFEAGFTRYHAREKAAFGFASNDWHEWAQSDYQGRGSDDDVVAFHWQDKYRKVNKLGLAITGYIEPSYGRLIEDLVFHFGSCREASTILDRMPEGYRKYTEKINNDYSDDLINEMVDLAKSNSPSHSEILSRNFWDGTLKKSSATSMEINSRIEHLKK